LIPYIKEYPISGIDGILKAYPSEDPLTHEWQVDIQVDRVTTKKSVDRFYDILNRPEVDPYRTFSDDCSTIHEVFGIEAAQEYAIREMCRILGFNIYTDDIRHVTLLAKTMSFGGELSATNRNGIDPKHQPISQIMFECPSENAVLAAVRNEMDPLTGSMSSVMFGFRANRMGTGAVRIQSS
jgi:DNA-directed RNA polymerase I subunit RPA1